MSWLVIDAGNSAIKWARSVADGTRFLGGRRVAQARDPLHGAPLDERLTAHWITPPPVAAFGVCVADDMTRLAVEYAVCNAGSPEIKWFGAQRHFEGRGVAHTVALLNGYRDPLQLGADRWHAMIAACAKYPDESLIVVSSGTATTVDCIRAEPLAAAIFVGGVIAPGYDLMGESLAQGTGQLPLADLRSEINGYPRSTNEAIAAGVHYAQVGLVENIARQFAAELDGDGKDAPRLLLSGGRGRALLAPLTRSLLAEKAVSSIVLESNLVLRGVALRAHNEGAPPPTLPQAARLRVAAAA